MLKQKTAKHYLQVDHREFSTILAALRFWQRKAAESAQHELEIARDGGKIAHCLSNTEIDKLCYALNTGDRDIIPMPDCITGNLTSAQDMILLKESSRYNALLGVEYHGDELQKHRKALIREHRNHALRIGEAGVYCRKCMKVIIHDVEMDLGEGK